MKTVNLLDVLMNIITTLKNEKEVSNYFESKYPWLRKDHVGNLYYYNEDTPLVCAHMDNVWSAVAHQNLHTITYDEETTIIKWTHNIWADDKCWLAFIDYLLQTKYNWNEPHNLSILLCVQEETGMLWSTTAAKNHDLLNTCNFCIILDRRNSSDIIRYCNDDFLQAIDAYSNAYWFREAWWLCCDLDQFCDIVPWVNLSCWYYNPHMDSEYISFIEYENAVMYAMSILSDDIVCNTKFTPYEAAQWYSANYTNGWANHYNEKNKSKWYDNDEIIIAPNDSVFAARPLVLTNSITWEQIMLEDWSWYVEDALLYDEFYNDGQTDNEDNPDDIEKRSTTPYKLH